MKAKDAIPAFAALTGEPLSEVKLVDRGLAENGMRAAGRGPKPPEMSQADAVRLVLGSAGGKVASRAFEYVRDAARFPMWTKYEPLEGDAKWLEALGATRADFEKLNLKDALLVIIDHLRSQNTVEVHLGVRPDAWVSITFRFEDKPSEMDGMEFRGATRFPAPPVGAFRRWTEVPTSVLRWIGENFAADHETDLALRQVGKVLQD